MAKAQSDPTIERNRWGGIALAAGLVLAIVSLTMFLTRPVPVAGTIAERAAAVAANANVIQLEGYIGMFGYALIATAAFFLGRREVDNGAGIPASSFWIPVGLGAFTLTGIEAWVAAGAAPMAAAFATSPALYTSITGTVNALWALATFGLAVGLAGVFYAEAKASAPAVPAAAAYVGVLGAALMFVAALGPLTGIREIIPLFAGTYLAYLPLLYLGARIAFPAAGGAASGTRRAAGA